ARVRDPHEDDDVRRRAVPAAGGRDRGGPVVARGRGAAAGGGAGGLRRAPSRGRFDELRRQAGWAKTFGLPLELIGTAEAQALFPLMSTDGVLGAVYLPTDGWLDPSVLALSLATGARSRGAQIRTHTRVVAIAQERGRVTGVT